jgi:hypothetical protein
METTVKRFNYQGYKIEFLPVSKVWIVLDWDYETENQIGFPHRTKAAAMAWCDRQLG